MGVPVSRVDFTLWGPSKKACHYGTRISAVLPSGIFNGPTALSCAKLLLLNDANFPNHIRIAPCLTQKEPPKVISMHILFQNISMRYEPQEITWFVL